MASKKFKTVSGGHVAIYVNWRPRPIEIPANGTYETDDKQELEALKASAELVEVKAGTPDRPQAKAVEAEKEAAPVEAEDKKSK